MALYCVYMLKIALELAKEDSSYEDVASKFFEHFVSIADAMNSLGGTRKFSRQNFFPAKKNIYTSFDSEFFSHSENILFDFSRQKIISRINRCEISWRFQIYLFSRQKLNMNRTLG